MRLIAVITNEPALIRNILKHLLRKSARRSEAESRGDCLLIFIYY